MDGNWHMMVMAVMVKSWSGFELSSKLSFIISVRDGDGDGDRDGDWDWGETGQPRRL